MLVIGNANRPVHAVVVWLATFLGSFSRFWPLASGRLRRVGGGRGGTTKVVRAAGNSKIRCSSVPAIHRDDKVAAWNRERGKLCFKP